MKILQIHFLIFFRCFFLSSWDDNHVLSRIPVCDVCSGSKHRVIGAFPSPGRWSRDNIKEAMEIEFAKEFQFSFFFQNWIMNFKTKFLFYFFGKLKNEFVKIFIFIFTKKWKMNFEK